MTVDHATWITQSLAKSMGMEGHDHHAMMIADFKKRFYVVLILTIPIMLVINHDTAIS